MSKPDKKTNTLCTEWAKHLRKYYKRVFNKRVRKKAKYLIKKDIF